MEKTNDSARFQRFYVKRIDISMLVNQKKEYMPIKDNTYSDDPLLRIKLDDSFRALGYT